MALIMRTPLSVVGSGWCQSLSSPPPSRYRSEPLLHRYRGSAPTPLPVREPSRRALGGSAWTAPARCPALSTARGTGGRRGSRPLRWGRPGWRLGACAARGCAVTAPAAMADPRLRQIKIKTGVVRRLAKEKIMYEKEAKQQEEKIEKMKAEACDDYGIKKQIEILQESRMMIPDCQRRLEVAHAELTQLLENEKELEEAEEYKEARSILESVKLEA
ncbi:tubulin-specific chaperone A [Agelaius phoeniceus]|uniref:tubulin-specific chaperone A n=1 Tax=Agelaius phoeniceus TaxID=39638 RepID=UPI0040552B63